MRERQTEIDRERKKESDRESVCVCVSLSLCMWKLFDSTLLLPSPHTHAQACELDMTFEEMFQEIMQRVVVVAAESNARVITVPSLHGVSSTMQSFPSRPLLLRRTRRFAQGCCVCVCVSVCMCCVSVCVCVCVFTCSIHI